MMRSNTVAIDSAVTRKPVSSNTSRATASSNRSPVSTKPPGKDHKPSSGGLPRSTSKIRPSTNTIPPTPNKGCAGNRRLSFLDEISGNGCQHFFCVSFHLHFGKDLFDVPVRINHKGSAVHAHVLLPIHTLFLPNT